MKHTQCYLLFYFNFCFISKLRINIKGQFSIRNMITCFSLGFTWPMNFIVNKVRWSWEWKVPFFLLFWINNCKNTWLCQKFSRPYPGIITCQRSESKLSTLPSDNAWVRFSLSRILQPKKAKRTPYSYP